MSNPLFCTECGGDLKITNNGYKCLNCNKNYPKSKDNNQKKQKKSFKEQ